MIQAIRQPRSRIKLALKPKLTVDVIVGGVVVSNARWFGRIRTGSKKQNYYLDGLIWDPPHTLLRGQEKRRGPNTHPGRRMPDAGANRHCMGGDMDGCWVLGARTDCSKL